MEFAVRSPGKIILFGEHAVVYGVPAIAASIALHTYIAVKGIDSTPSHTVELEFPDVNLNIRWTEKDFKDCASIKPTPPSEIPTELDPRIHKLAKGIVDSSVGLSSVFSNTAALAFLYLYLSIYFPHTPQSSNLPGLRFKTISTLPIGAGLGSSASFSVSLAAALLRASGQLDDTTLNEHAIDLISKWSFLGECCIHGRPSGIDNIVATRGGAVFFQRRTKQNAAGETVSIDPLIKPYTGFPELELVLTDTTIPRQTSELVARVARIRSQWPSVFEHLMCAFTEIVKEADSLISKAPADPDIVSKLSELADLNHGLLVTVSVSHPSLERVRDISKEVGIGTTKLTGAGGGGCAITIATRSNSTGSTSVSRSAELAVFREKLGPEYKIFATNLGGPGVEYADGPAAVDSSSLNELNWKAF